MTIIKYSIVFHLDNDEVGIGATTKIISILNSKYQCIDEHPTSYIDVNDELIHKNLLLSTVFAICKYSRFLLITILASLKE